MRNRLTAIYILIAMACAIVLIMVGRESPESSVGSIDSGPALLSDKMPTRMATPAGDQWGAKRAGSDPLMSIEGKGRTNVLSGFVVDAVTKAPILARLQYGSQEKFSQARDGFFQIVAQSGSQTVECIAPGYNPRELMLSGGSTVGLTLELRPINRVEVVIYDEQGWTVPGASLYSISTRKSHHPIPFSEWRQLLGKADAGGGLSPSLAPGTLVYAVLDGRSSSPRVVSDNGIELVLNSHSVNSFGIRTLGPTAVKADSFVLACDGFPAASRCNVVVSSGVAYPACLPLGAYTLLSPDFRWTFNTSASKHEKYLLGSTGLDYSDHFRVEPKKGTAWLNAKSTNGPYLDVVDERGLPLRSFRVWEEVAINQDRGGRAEETWYPLDFSNGMESDGGPISLAAYGVGYLTRENRRFVVGALGFDSAVVPRSATDIEGSTTTISLVRSDSRFWIRVCDSDGSPHRSVVVVKDPSGEFELIRTTPSSDRGLVGPIKIAGPPHEVQVLASTGVKWMKAIGVTPSADQDKAPIALLPPLGALRVTNLNGRDPASIRSLATSGKVIKGFMVDGALEFKGLPAGRYRLLDQGAVRAALDEISKSALFSTPMNVTKYDILIAEGETKEVALPASLMPHIVEGHVLLPENAEGGLFLCPLSNGGIVPRMVTSMDHVLPLAPDGHYSIQAGYADWEKLAIVRIVGNAYIPLGYTHPGETTRLDLARLSINANGLADYCVQISVKAEAFSRFLIACSEQSEFIDAGWLPIGPHDLRIQDKNGLELWVPLVLESGAQAIEFAADAGTRSEQWSVGSEGQDSFEWGR